MKTFIEWFEELPPGYRERAIKRYKEKPMFRREPYSLSLSVALFNGFEWRKTKEGHNFWKKIYEHYINLSNEIPPLPPE